jgi:poly(hydroxyalkanoate) depolymerase family esterase
MARQARNPFLSKAFRRSLGVMARSGVRAGAKVVAQALKTSSGTRKTGSAQRPLVTGAVRKKPSLALPESQWISGSATTAAGARRYHLYLPPGISVNERVPLLVMLHGCLQDAEALAAISRMNRVAARQGFVVLYPEQNRLSNAQRCWNWYDIRSGRAHAEATVLEAAIDQVCRTRPVDSRRVVLAGLSAGAGMAALLATRRPERYRAVAMHSGIAPGVAHSSATALGAMRGRVTGRMVLPVVPGTVLPALLVIQGSADPVVGPANGADAARMWAASEDARPGPARTLQRGQRYASTVTDYRIHGRLVATLCLVNGLGHAWSGGAAGHSYSDPEGPDATRMIWSFAAKQFKAPAAGPVVDER